MTALDPDLLIRAYSAGIFPMGDARDIDDVYWVEPKRRGIIPLEGFHLPHSLAKLLRHETFEHRVDTAFTEVMRACAAPAPGREDSWINEPIVAAYTQLHKRGLAHSVECWASGKLVGGLYGVSLGGAFFGESMFTRVRDASKAALAHLVARLRFGRFFLLDTQFVTPHLAGFGAVEISREAYRGLLSVALAVDADFGALDSGSGLDLPGTMVSGPVSGKLIVQLLTQTS